MVELRTKIKGLNGAVVNGPIEKVNPPYIVYGSMITWKLPLIFREMKKKHITVRITSLREEGDVIFAEGDEVE